ncbi:TIGR03790 family protein [Roseateles cavernae]|uniref:TIGR03790 family protein n=1 Tax=Roseateles cavernae TaxID=3153578 RepID=UPI0032E3B516
MSTFLACAALLLTAVLPIRAAADCKALDNSLTVRIGAYDSGVDNPMVEGKCTIDDLLDDERTWGSQREFLDHAGKVFNDLLKDGLISLDERDRLMAAARSSGIGSQLTVKLIAFNDLHGAIKSAEGAPGNPGVARLANRIQALKATNPLHAVVSAGDMVGASPLSSALFKDEPTIEAMNRIGIDFAATGVHEFDEGRDELLRLQQGGNHPSSGFSGQGLAADRRQDGQFSGAAFQFLAANVMDAASLQALLPALGYKEFMGHRIAFIGVARRSTPAHVPAAGVAGLEFRDEAETINALVPGILAQGVKSIVVLVHEGGLTAGGTSNGCSGLSGPIVDLVGRLDPEIDLIVSGGSHLAYNCSVNNRAGIPVPLTSAGHHASHLSDIELTLDTSSGNVVAASATNYPIGPDEPEAAEIQAVVAHYAALASATPAVGRITAEALGLVINLNDPYSVAVGEYYARRRGIPESHIVRVSLPTTASISRSSFEALAAELRNRLPETVQGLALAWVKPYAVECNSITSALTMGFQPEICSSPNVCTPSKASPYFRYIGARPFTDMGQRPSMLIAARSIDSAKALIERGISADQSMPADHRSSAKAYFIKTWDGFRSVRHGDFPAAGPIGPWGLTVQRESLNSGYTQVPISEVLIYQTGLTRVDGLNQVQWRPGALADHLTSFGGRLDAAPGSAQMSVLDWIESGATASYGTVTEPCNYNTKFPHPRLLTKSYLQGATALEAYWKSVEWPGQGVFVGEPLAAPFAPLLELPPGRP